MDRICKYYAGDFRLFGHLFGYTNLAIIPLNDSLENKKVPFPNAQNKKRGWLTCLDIEHKILYITYLAPIT
jgi:hypothetical protein